MITSVIFLTHHFEYRRPFFFPPKAIFKCHKPTRTKKIGEKITPFWVWLDTEPPVDGCCSKKETSRDLGSHTEVLSQIKDLMDLNHMVRLLAEDVCQTLIMHGSCS